MPALTSASPYAPANGRADARPRKPRPDPLPNAFSYTVPDACRMGGFGTTKAYELIRQGRLKVTKVAGRTLILGDSLRALLTPTA